MNSQPLLCCTIAFVMSFGVVEQVLFPFTAIKSFLEPTACATIVQSETNDLTERDEIRRSVRLDPGATVEVRGINGSVSVETSETDTAEILVVRSARDRESLEHRQVIIEASEQRLVIRGENDNDRDSSRVNVRQRVSLRLPRRISMNVRGVNGRVTVGDIEGPVHVSGINGRTEIRGAVGAAEISGVNGAVMLVVTRLGEEGLRVSGVNGDVELQLDSGTNADLSGAGVNGQIDSRLTGVAVESGLVRGMVRARIGAGGAPIRMTGINGRLIIAPRG